MTRKICWVNSVQSRERSRDRPADISREDGEANFDGDPGDHPDRPTRSNKRNGNSGSKRQPQGKDEGKGKHPAGRKVIDNQVCTFSFRRPSPS